MLISFFKKFRLGLSFWFFSNENQDNSVCIIFTIYETNTWDYFIRLTFSKYSKKLTFETNTKKNNNFKIFCSIPSFNTIYFILFEIDLLNSIMKMKVFNEDKLEICSKEGSPTSDDFIEKLLKFNIRMGSTNLYFMGYLENLKFYYRTEENFVNSEKISRRIYTECDSGYFSDELTNECKICNENCQTCKGISSEDCLSCRYHSFLINNQSVGKCSDKCPNKDDVVKLEVLNHNYVELFNDGITNQNSFITHRFSSNFFKDSMFPLIFEYLFNYLFSLFYYFFKFFDIYYF